jgi:hypothetical protein
LGCEVSGQRDHDHGDATCLVCLIALGEARRDLESARRRHTAASVALLVSREKLERVVDPAPQEQSFSLLEALFLEEEAALVAYEHAIARLAAAEQRWCALKGALACEQEMIKGGHVTPPTHSAPS